MLSSLRIVSSYSKRVGVTHYSKRVGVTSGRISQAPERYGFYVDAEEHELGDLNEPPNYKAALSNPESDKWLDAMNTEMQSIKDNQVWCLVNLPPNGRTVGSKWLFKKKYDMNGNVHTFKARMVAKGYTQTYSVDYGKTFSPVADIRAIRILLAITAFYDYDIWQMDVKIAFLNGHLSEDVYMVQPEGFVDPKHLNKVCKLQQSVYGLKQASRSWNKRFDEEIKMVGFTQNPDEPCVYLKASGSNVAFLVLYVDDILIMGNNVTMLQDVKNLRWKTPSAMQEKPDFRKSQGAKTPSEVKRMQRVPYASAIRSIMYAVRCTRSDVAFAQNLCSLFQQNPNEAHSTTVKTILKYLRNTKDIVLVYGGNPETELKVTCYIDAGFQTNKDDTNPNQDMFSYLMVEQWTRRVNMLHPFSLQCLERISHKKTKNQAKSDKTGHGMEKWADYANLGNFIYKRKKGEKENEKKKDVEGLFFQHPVLLPYFYPATLHQPLDKTFPLTPHGHNAKLAIQGHFRSKG
ncbi:retrotransposon protein, putative, ty1-copia subclass [Tanacetum coccineum]